MKILKGEIMKYRIGMKVTYIYGDEPGIKGPNEWKIVDKTPGIYGVDCDRYDIFNGVTTLKGIREKEIKRSN